MSYSPLPDDSSDAGLDAHDAPLPSSSDMRLDDSFNAELNTTAAKLRQVTVPWESYTRADLMCVATEAPSGARAAVH